MPKLVWIVKYNHARLNTSFRILDPVKGQRLLQDLAESLSNGCVVTLLTFDPKASLFESTIANEIRSLAKRKTQK